MGFGRHNVSLLYCTVVFASIQCCCPQKKVKVSFSPRWCLGIETGTCTVHARLYMTHLAAHFRYGEMYLILSNRVHF